ncbi:hypothetical protein SUGI_0025870 [Cryptomeria japonica]|nr:hypothetical protein SUGI_0025870 [Cryptomeria japonica]
MDSKLYFSSVEAQVGVFEIIHTYREGNRVVDLLENMGVEVEDQFCLIRKDDTQQELMEAIRNDMPYCPRQEEDIYEMILEMVDISLNTERHWCDGFIYKVVLVPLVDVLESKEKYLEEESKEEEDQSKAKEDSNMKDLNDSDDEREERAWKDKKRRKTKFIKMAWVVFRDKVLNSGLTESKQLKCAEDWLLSKASSDSIFNLGELVSQLLHFLRND